ncbi:hypothetical protein GLOIN_2v1791224 [Rhizophagus irregularis DAOM 181602=DAOM 197198]|uniref:Crinkler effector protein N-terminal domain-containing protein n=2 Tax=Rhizophagus irregularis TaxID=588596 RepID=A0A2P4NXI4_RHIID|nr:hypothetical protein GLOIN_2v1791224 [Rhizophagus irregularis DAOM 181602=DAOM 197198]POG57833.1 hypothetical protein GLOIN_2v1791224 [Rhizophagus irregularis DAOM 181602=DAOM 197198]|eukprot:XP_025164699.1 hypothetical protein GLOIN_2v1791224 [Rhizophagus irregularis DAOM 181602=DAOM 197198]
MVGCFILGSGIVFNFEIGQYKDFTQLKKAIWEEDKEYFESVGIKNEKRFKLWKVQISTKNNNEYDKLLENHHEDLDVKEDFGGERLDETWLIDSIFKCPPPEEHIHIMVQPPPPATTDAPKKGISRLGGLGGTKYLGLENGFFYEGVNLTSASICRREPTINKLLKSLLKERIILIRSPPMTGKTSLGQLLEAKLLQLDEVQNGSARVFRISLIWIEKMTTSWTFSEGFEKLLGINWDDFLDQCGHKKTYLIVDEVQKIYRQSDGEPHHDGSVFWNSFKRIMQNLQLFIVALASYGHYGAYATRGNRSAMDISPVNNLTAKNKWGYKDICYTEDEFKDYFDRFCGTYLKEELVKDDIPCLFSYLSEITAYHPGLIAYTMDHIGERFTKKRSNSLSFDAIFSYLKSQDFNDIFKTIRAFYPVTDLSDEERQIVDSVLFKKGGLDYETEKIPNNGRLLKTNALVDTSSSKSHIALLDFPAPLLRITYLQNRFGSISRPKSPPSTFNEFIKLVLAKMNPKILRKSKGRGTDGRLLERVWQMEFYRASMQVLSNDTCVSVDAGSCFGSNGYIDFYVNNKNKWAIELLRDGNKLEEHQKRFEKGGIYIPILKHANKWAVIDIRSSGMEAPDIKDRKKYDIYVLCAENFESVQLIYPSGTEEPVRLLGEEENLLGYNISDFLDDPMETD